MRAAKRLQTIHVKDEQGRIVSSWQRVRVPVPDGISASLPPPYTGLKHLTKKVRTEAEYAETKARFLAVIAGAGEWAAIHRELGDLNGLSLDEIMRRGPAPYRVFAKLDQKQDEILGVPAWKNQPQAEPVYFDVMIPKWAKHYGKGKKSRQDMGTKCGVFIEWLRRKYPERQDHDNIAKVTFEDGRDWLEAMLDGEGALAPGSIKNHLGFVKGLFSFAFKKGYLKLPADPMEKVSYTPPEGNKRDDFTLDERRRILTAALEADPTIKWLTFLSAFELTRTSEIADCDTRDFVLVDGIWVHKIQRKYRSEDQRLKTKPSTRDMPLHSGILNAGFIPYLRSLPPGPLFASLRLDSYGKRATHASKITNKWLREVVGIDDPLKPFYSLRHSGITDLRTARTPNGEVAVKEKVEMYLTAHGKKDIHGNYGQYPVTELKAAIEWVKNPLLAVPALAEAAD
jgi:integrase